ncbi:MAG TPA: hypothetical protein VJT49_10585 [Amycolatopsis sp.]|uniref:hypothetical protein n=1 Tax=Amycolatopsis sp. TaxID=37632 RepID=UPI002B494419|nr:hypothetical protein [Amycolatopsis sp.]HKS45541.1 hypothetical protein [Amycolatopsis sp.]
MERPRAILGPEKPRPAEVPLLIGRPWPGTVSETRRVAHLFPVPDRYPTTLTARCGAEFWSGDLEFLDRVGGMPCTACLVGDAGAGGVTAGARHRNVTASDHSGAHSLWSEA